jgi:murein DD-endopeptidase MepM/ murein hydrolase activator NlpD
MTGLALCLVLAAGDVESERQQLAHRLAVEKAAFDAMEGQKKSALTVLETLERLARESWQRTASLEKALKRIKAQTAAATRDEAALEQAMAAQRAVLAPHLVTLDRVQRHDALGFLLSSQDFTTLLKRQRALKTLVSADARALEDLATLSRYSLLEARRLERLDGAAQEYLKALRDEQAVAAARRGRFQDVISTIGAQQNQSSRLIAELEAQEKELSGMLADMKSGPGLTGFRARKGHLPMPTNGLLEVGYGKVVNPRFNTVTVQKGIDLRAPEGTAVSSVGQGTVVFSGWLKGYGNLVIVDHGQGYHSLYAHLASSQVEPGNEVEEGEQLGTVGDTGSLKGPYLYFEIRKGGQATDPVPWLAPSE